jgi:hypothetical protein
MNNREKFIVLSINKCLFITYFITVWSRFAPEFMFIGKCTEKHVNNKQILFYLQ